METFSEAMQSLETLIAANERRQSQEPTCGTCASLLALCDCLPYEDEWEDE